jgi:redox-sensitive bicupin YhaK (pirin superfamily)
VARGQVKVNETVLDGGDGLAIDGLQTLHLEGLNQAEVLLFDLP